MKRTHVATLAILALSGLTTSQALARIFLQNNYLKPVQYVQQPADRAHLFAAKILGNGARAAVGGVTSVREFFTPSKQFLSISTVGGRYYDISYLFDTIDQEQKKHGNADAIIMINPSYGIYGWNITIEWETPKPIGMTESTMGK